MGNAPSVTHPLKDRLISISLNPMKHSLLLGLLLLTQVACAQSDKEKAAATVQKNTIQSHLYFLSDDLLEGRDTGSKGNKMAALYLANQLRRYGAQPIPGTGSYYQTFDLERIQVPQFVNLSLKGTSYPLNLTLEMPALDLKGEALFLGYGTESDLEGHDLKGKLVVVYGGTEKGQNIRSLYGAAKEKRKRARELGAIGLVELVDIEEGPWTNLKHNWSQKITNKKEETPETPLPHVWVNIHAKDPGFAVGSSMPFTLASDGKRSTALPTQNVIGIIEGTDPQLKNEYVIYSAHYDHIGIGRPNAEGDSIYNGARDNGIGVTAVLSMAENLAQYPTKRSALFIFFTGEELGLLGSGYYVEHPVIPLKQMAYCFNTDGGGYNNTGLATIVGLERTSAQHNIETGAAAFGLKAVGDPAPEQNLFDRSDNVYFAQKGIPAPTYSTGFDAFDEAIEKYYHQADDEADSLDYDYLLKFYQGYVLSGRLIANDPTFPTWVAGDKYEAAYKALHGVE